MAIGGLVSSSIAFEPGAVDARAVPGRRGWQRG
jgi:hypothetical protein